MASESVTINVHLGTGVRGRMRKIGLGLLAQKANVKWGGEPSVGRWVTGSADDIISPIIERAIELTANDTGISQHVTELMDEFDFNKRGNARTFIIHAHRINHWPGYRCIQCRKLTTLYYRCSICEGQLCERCAAISTICSLCAELCE